MSAPDVSLTKPLSPDASESAPARDVSRRVFAALVICAMGLGLALRLRAAAGDLWLDEIWSVNLVKRAKTIGDVFLRIPYDNNHYLNSAWLWIVGPNAPVAVMRLASIALGVLSIPAAAAIGRRYSNLSGVVAGFLVAFGYFFVHYGSEARGYSGMILAILLAYCALERICDERSSTRAYLFFAAAICFGTFSHLTMVDATGALCIAGAARVITSGAPSSTRLRRIFAISFAAALGSLPALACFGVGAMSPDFKVGIMEPFTFQALAQGLADMARTTLGFPQALGDGAVVAVTALFALACLALMPASRRWFPALAIFGLPAAHAMLHLPSQFYARFHLTAAVALVLLAGDGFAAVWSRGSAWRAAAAGALALIIAGQTFELRQFFIIGRGDYSAAVRTMARDGAFFYSAETLTNETKAVANYEAARLSLSATAVDEANWCSAPPDWMIVATTPRSPLALSDARVAGPSVCASRFVRESVFPAWGLSGFVWTLYRRSG